MSPVFKGSFDAFFRTMQKRVANQKPEEPDRCPTCGSETLKNRLAIGREFNIWSPVVVGAPIPCNDPWHDKRLDG